MKVVCLVGAFIQGSGALPALAGLSSPGDEEYSVYEDGWTPWAAPNGAYGDATAILRYESFCGVVMGPEGPAGTESFFSFTFDANDCVSVGAPDDGFTVGSFEWSMLDQGERKELSCIDVSGQVTTEGSFEGEIDFSPEATINSFSTSTTTRQDRFENIDVLSFTLDVEQVIAGEAGALDVGDALYEVSISVRPCLRGTPDFDLDIDHYLDRAAQAERSALPDTL